MFEEIPCYELISLADFYGSDWCRPKFNSLPILTPAIPSLESGTPPTQLSKTCAKCLRK